MSTKKAMGTSKNGRDSWSKSLGLKKSNLSFVNGGDLLSYNVKGLNGIRYRNHNIGQGVCISNKVGNVTSNDKGFFFLKKSYYRKAKLFFVI